ncbi:MAG: hypothetical protein K2L77_02415, partial [Muribaculaceae bacterium]|nr:hypothetical protein [Muribaculaceae bacterium]
NAVDSEATAAAIEALVAATIELDREHRYLGSLLSSLYGEDYKDRAAELSAVDNNFRRMYKRLFPNPESL